MKRKLFIIIGVAMLATSISAQRVISPTITSTKTLKTTDLGNQKLEVAITNNDTVYCVVLKTGHRVNVVVSLGGTDKALQLLQFLYDYEPKKGDIIDFENETHNMAKWQGASGYLVYSEGKQFTGHLRKPNIKGFISSIKEFAGRKE